MATFPIVFLVGLRLCVLSKACGCAFGGTNRLPTSQWAVETRRLGFTRSHTTERSSLASMQWHSTLGLLHGRCRERRGIYYVSSLKRARATEPRFGPSQIPTVESSRRRRRRVEMTPAPPPRDHSRAARVSQPRPHMRLKAVYQCRDSDELDSNIYVAAFLPT